MYYLFAHTKGFCEWVLTSQMCVSALKMKGIIHNPCRQRVSSLMQWPFTVQCWLSKRDVPQVNGRWRRKDSNLNSGVLKWSIVGIKWYLAGYEDCTTCLNQIPKEQKWENQDLKASLDLCSKTVLECWGLGAWLRATVLDWRERWRQRRGSN